MADSKSRSTPPKSRSGPPRQRSVPPKPAPAQAPRMPRPISPLGAPRGRLRKIDPAAGPAPAARPEAAAHAPTPAGDRAPAPAAKPPPAPRKGRSQAPKVASSAPPAMVLPKSPPLLIVDSPRSIIPTSTPDDGGHDALSVLVVDDDDAARRLIVRALRMLFTVYEAADGEEAMRVLERGPPVACVVTDIMMPRVDGVMLAKRMRADPRLRAVPIVFVTGRGQVAESVLDGINVGARFTIQKPFKVKDLVEKIRSVVLTTAGAAR